MEELITEEQVLALTNNQKREDFIKTWPEWPVLVKVPLLELTVRQIVLPNKKRIISLEYGSIHTNYRHCYFQRRSLTEGINPFNDTSDNLVIDELKNLKADIIAQRKRK